MKIFFFKLLGKSSFKLLSYNFCDFEKDGGCANACINELDGNRSS